MSHPRARLYRALATPMYAGARIAGVHRRPGQSIIVRRVELPTRLGVRIVLAADFHFDPLFFPPARVREVVDLINAVDDVDLVALPGDFVGHDPAVIDWAAPELGRLEPPAFATLGNHDHMEDAARVTDRLEASGIEVLTNRAATVTAPDGEPVVVVGVDSVFVGPPPPGLVESLRPDGARCLVLGHEPVLATMHDEVLHLAGHTHHGQIRHPRVPFRLLPRGSRPFPEGLAIVERDPDPRFVYTTGGLGSTTLPVRIGVPPEIVVLDA